MPATTAEPVQRETSATRDPARWVRRAIAIPAITLLAALVCAAMPALLPIAFLVDLVRGKKLALSRCVLFFVGYLAGEVSFIAVSFLQWLLAPGLTQASRRRLLAWTHGLGWAWGTYLDGFGRWCFNVRLDVTGLEALHGPPAIVFLRHASVADNLLAPVFVAGEGGYALRYVAKQEVQKDPIFDIIGNRMGSCFVRRASGNPEREIAAVTALLDDVGPRDAIVIWPEGTRFTAEKRARILEGFEKRGDPALTARARALRHVLPPRLGGPVALLEKAVANGLGTDVVFAYHAGYEGAATFGDLVQGRAIGRTVRVHFERVPFSELPRGREALSEWFYSRWERVDAWVDAELPKVLGKS